MFRNQTIDKIYMVLKYLITTYTCRALTQIIHLLLMYVQVMYLLLVSFVVKRIYIIIYLRNILLFNDLSVTANRKKHLMNTCFLKYLKNISSPSLAQGLEIKKNAFRNFHFFNLCG